MASERHNSHLKQYLQSHRTPAKSKNGRELAKIRGIESENVSSEGAGPSSKGTSPEQEKPGTSVSTKFNVRTVTNRSPSNPRSGSGVRKLDEDKSSIHVPSLSTKSLAGHGDKVPSNGTAGPNVSRLTGEQRVKSSTRNDRMREQEKTATMSPSQKRERLGMQQRQRSDISSKSIGSGSIKPVPLSRNMSPLMRRTPVNPLLPWSHGGPSGCSSKQIMKNFPDELLMKIFSYLGPSDLLLVGRVCRHWLGLTNDNLIWQDMYQKYVKRRKGEKPPTVPKNPPDNFWKSLCIKRCAENRTIRALLLLRKIHPFTGLPRDVPKALGASGTQWLMIMRDKNNQEHVFSYRDVFYFEMGVILRWYHLEFPPVDRIKKLTVMAANSVFFDKNLVALPNSAYQRSLLFEVNFDWHNISKRPPDSFDDAIDIRLLPSGLLIATWKEGGNLAFITGSFHTQHFVHRCLLGSSTSPYIPMITTPPSDDIDSIRGLHSYQCTLELHNQRTSFWSQQFQDVYCKPDNIGEGLAIFQLIKEEATLSHTRVPEGQLNFLWITDLFRGKVQNVCILDVTLLDENRTPIWCVSSPVNFTDYDTAEVVYNYHGISGLIEYTDDKGRVYMKLIWDPNTNELTITCLELRISLLFINKWFRTNYQAKLT